MDLSCGGILLLCGGFFAIIMPMVMSTLVAYFLGWMSIVVGVLLFVRSAVTGPSEDRLSTLVTGGSLWDHRHRSHRLALQGARGNHAPDGRLLHTSRPDGSVRKACSAFFNSRSPGTLGYRRNRAGRAPPPLVAGRRLVGSWPALRDSTDLHGVWNCWRSGTVLIIHWQGRPRSEPEGAVSRHGDRA